MSWIFQVFSVWGLIAQPASDGSPASWIQFGITGMIIGALLTGWLWAKPAVDRMIKEFERAMAERDRIEERLINDRQRVETQRDELLHVYEDKVIPALSESAQSHAAIKPLIEEAVRALVQRERDDRR